MTFEYTGCTNFKEGSQQRSVAQSDLDRRLVVAEFREKLAVSKKQDRSLIRYDIISGS
jgi:hypothetical protein